MNPYGERLKAHVVLGELAVFLALLTGNGCVQNSQLDPAQEETMALRDINAVLSDHDEALMAIDGVVGVAVGLLDDETTLCLKVLVIQKTPELVGRIPAFLEGHPVVIEETGVIRPF